MTADAFNATTHEYPSVSAHPTTGQRQRTNSEAVTQTNNGNHQATNDKADDRAGQPRLLHPIEGQDIGAPTNCRTHRHRKDP
ncbi:hypothetical protein GCM10009604_04620 [Corynebacterium aurimucosum]